jgi:AraC-like DNA-binding protein
LARLARAHRLLTDPRYRDRNISAVGYEAGFGDLSYFNRTFRHRYGMTPSDVREAAHGSDHRRCCSILQYGFRQTAPRKSCEF